MLAREAANTMPIDSWQDGNDLAADSTATAPGASELSTTIASNFPAVSFCIASWAPLQWVTSISRPFRTSTTKATIS